GALLGGGAHGRLRFLRGRAASERDRGRGEPAECDAEVVEPLGLVTPDRLASARQSVRAKLPQGDGIGHGGGIIRRRGPTLASRLLHVVFTWSGLPSNRIGGPCGRWPRSTSGPTPSSSSSPTSRMTEVWRSFPAGRRWFAWEARRCGPESCRRRPSRPAPRRSSTSSSWPNLRERK